MDVWYGSQQSVGAFGITQRWANVLGRANGPNPVTSLTYSLNGGSARPLSMGPNLRRLVMPGDFNIDILVTDLLPGPNTVDITAVDSTGAQVTEEVTITNHVGFSDPTWWDQAWSWRTAVTLSAGSVDRTDAVVEAPVDFTAQLASAGETANIDTNSIRVIETAPDGSVLDASVPFQFDPDDGFDGSTNAAGTVMVLMGGNTPAGTERTFDIYFDDVAAGHTVVSFADQVTVTDNVADAGENTLQVATASTTWFFDKDGGGFTSVLDADGNDWVSYGPAAGSAGQYRGIPNMVFPEGIMHPGAEGITTTLLADGPLRTSFRSASAGEGWVTRWDILPDRARMTVEAAAHDYWFLYEGTPGGTLDTATDLVVRSDGTQGAAGASWNGDLAGDEWVYFADPGVDRSLFVVNHNDDTAVDSYSSLNSEMTVLGFGRDGINPFLDAVPASFTVGLTDGVGFGDVSPLAGGAIDPVAVTVGTLEEPVAGAASWPLPATVDWSGASSPTDRAVVVDGKWHIEGDEVRTTDMGYDRLINIGNQTWTDYEVSAPVTVHSLDFDNGFQSGPPLIGYILRWNGHNDTIETGRQPQQGWLPDTVNPTPLGAMALVRWHSDGSTPIHVWNHRTANMDTNPGLQLQVGSTYMFKASVKTLPGGDTEYKFRVWPQGTPEPGVWSVEFVAGTDDHQPANGSLQLVAHEADVSFGTVEVTPVTP